MGVMVTLGLLAAPIYFIPVTNLHDYDSGPIVPCLQYFVNDAIPSLPDSISPLARQLFAPRAERIVR
jgi:hypothetical protein